MTKCNQGKAATTLLSAHACTMNDGLQALVRLFGVLSIVAVTEHVKGISLLS